MEKISIIIPVYNGEEFLKRCLDSIIVQTYENWELIIVNDGSTDKTKDIIEEYIKKDKRIVVINKDNSGVSDSRNVGIDYSTGDYITFVDADDFLEENMLLSIIELLNKEKYDVIRYNYFKSYSNNKETKNIYDKNITNRVLEKKEINDKIIPDILYGKMPAYVWLLVINRNIIDKMLKFNTSLDLMEDTVFYINLLMNINNMFIYDMCLYHYYYRLESTSHLFSNSIRNLNNILLVNKIEEKLITDKNLNVENNKLLYNTAHAKMIENICYEIFKNYSIEETKEKIKDIYNKTQVKEILNASDKNRIPIHKRVAIILLIKGKLNLLINYYKFRRLLKKYKGE